MRGYGKSYYQKQLHKIVIRQMYCEQDIAVYRYNKMYIRLFFANIRLWYWKRQFDNIFRR